MSYEKICPALLILIDVCAAGIYSGQGDWRRTVYWLCAAALTASVTY